MEPVNSIEEAIFNYFASTFKYTTRPKIIVYDEYSKKILLCHKILINKKFIQKYGIVGDDDVNNLYQKRIDYDIVYVFEKSSSIIETTKSKNTKNVYINYFKNDDGCCQGTEIMLDKITVMANIVKLDNSLPFITFIHQLGQPFQIRYEDGITVLPSIETDNTWNTLFLLKREYRQNELYRYRTRVVDYIWDMYNDETVREIMKLKEAKIVMKEMMLQNIEKMCPFLLEKLKKLQKSKLAKFEKGELSVLEMGTISAKEIKKYNKDKKALKLNYELADKCMIKYHSLLDKDFIRMSQNSSWKNIYKEIKIFLNTEDNYMILNYVNKLKGNHNKWKKIIDKINKKYNTQIDNTKPSLEKKIVKTDIMGIRSTIYPKSIKVYKHRRHIYPTSIYIYNIDTGITSHDVTDTRSYYVGHFVD